MLYYFAKIVQKPYGPKVVNVKYLTLQQLHTNLTHLENSGWNISYDKAESPILNYGKREKKHSYWFYPVESDFFRGLDTDYLHFMGYELTAKQKICIGFDIKELEEDYCLDGIEKAFLSSEQYIQSGLCEMIALYFENREDYYLP
mgnify:CR=1 FL=1